MIPVGYNAKHIARPEEWLRSDVVEEILSVGECWSEAVVDYTEHWLCNDWFLYESEAKLDAALHAASIKVDDTVRRFFYESHPEHFDDGQWKPIVDAPRAVQARPAHYTLRGFDIVCMLLGPPDCSPLSCNSGAEHFAVNRHCLVDSLEQALKIAEAVDDGSYEPGPYGVFAVWEAITSGRASDR